MSSSIRYSTVALECPDAGTLADFYAELTGATATCDDDGRWATVQGDGWRLDFQTAPNHTPPVWPDPSSSMQMHLDFDVDDAAEAEAKALAAGATKFETQTGTSFQVYADPAGHPFCLCVS